MEQLKRLNQTTSLLKIEKQRFNHPRISKSNLVRIHPNSLLNSLFVARSECGMPMACLRVRRMELARSSVSLLAWRQKFKRSIFAWHKTVQRLSQQETEEDQVCEGGRGEKRATLNLPVVIVWHFHCFVFHSDVIDTYGLAFAWKCRKRGLPLVKIFS